MIQTERHRIKKCNFINFPEFAINYPDSLLSYGNLHPQIQILNLYFFCGPKDQLVNITNTRLDVDSFNTVNSLAKSTLYFIVPPSRLKFQFAKFQLDSIGSTYTKLYTRLTSKT